MIQETDLRVISLMIEKMNRLIEVVSNHSREEIEANYVYSDTIQFEFEKLYEDMTRLSPEFRIEHPNLHIDDLRGIRNRVAHDYASVSLKILIDTIEKNIPTLKEMLENVINN